MPFRFYCPHCQQRLSVSSQKRGQDVTCPRCRRVIQVPTRETSAGETDGPPADRAADHAAEPFPQVADRGELVAHAAAAPGPGLRQQITLPRYVLYTQGILLGAVALVFFVFGMVVGGRSAPRTAEQAGSELIVTGTVQLADGDEAVQPDEGSVVLLLPTARLPDEKLAAGGLRPDNVLSPDEHPARPLLRGLGGDLARVDRRGNYRVQASGPGRYYLLIISQHKRRAADESPAATDLARLGRYVTPPTDLLGRQQYQWQELLLRKDQQVDVTF